MAEAAEKRLETEIEEDMGEQFVTFHVADEGFGLSMKQVAEIIRLPETVGVPMTPHALIGLANLRGNVLPIVDLRRLLHLEEASFSDSTRVLVADAGRPVGLIVDRVSKVVNVDAAKIEQADGVKTAADTKMLTGVIREEGNLVQLLDVEQLLDCDFSQMLSCKGASIAANEAVNNVVDLVTEEDVGQLVSFYVENQEYAFDLMEVEEIVRVPENIAEMPATEHHVLGMIDLRGRLLPLVSLRRMFGFKEKDLDEHNRVLVIGVRAAGGLFHSVGIVVDDVREVINVAMSDRDKVPSLLGESNGEISSVCRLDNGKRLISILSAKAMFEDQAIQAAVESNSEEKISMNEEVSAHEEGDSEDDDTQMVVFKLAEQEYGVTIDDVQEITRVPDEMSKVPKTAEFIEGMVNLRGTVLPVLDMRSRFGLSRIERNDRQRILVFNIDGSRTGFIMDSVVEVLRLNRHNIEEAPGLSNDQTRVMGRVVNLKEEKRMIQVLNVYELLSKNEGKALEKLES